MHEVGALVEGTQGATFLPAAVDEAGQREARADVERSHALGRPDLMPHLSFMLGRGLDPWRGEGVRSAVEVSVHLLLAAPA